MSKEVKLLPELRFPEFANHFGWQNKKLGDNDVSTILRGGSPRPITDYLTDNDEGLNWLKIGDVDKESKFVLKTEDKVLPSALSKTREVFPGDLIMSNSMSFGRPYILKIQTCIHDGWIAVTEINQEIYTDFLYYLILSDGSQRYFTNSAAGGGIKNLNAEIIKKLPIAVPSIIEEQQKIASCLSSLDELIAAHNDKLDALKDHKKGLMQNLFPQEGETVPKVRFKEFEGDGDWVEHQLENITEKIQDGTHFSPKSHDSGDFLYITSKNVKNGYIELSTAQFVTKEDHDNIYQRCDVKQGDVLLTKDGTIGQACVNELTVPFSLLSSVAFIRPKSNYLNYFLYHLLVSDLGQKEIKSQIAGQALRRITLTKIKNFKFSFPGFSEQQKVADCLSAVDELINAQTDKIAQLQQHKKGLMQGLFPKIDS